MFSFFLKRKKHLSLEGLVMVYLYKCPICAFRAMDRTKGCGSGDFISTAFLSVCPSIGHLTETSLKMSYVHHPGEEGGKACCTTAKIHTIQPLFKEKVLERNHLLDQIHVFDVFRCVDFSHWITGSLSSRSTCKKKKKSYSLMRYLTCIL